MKQRVGIAQALLNDPQLLIVDEPTAGLDPEERVRFRNLLSDLSGERIVVLSTHIVSDIEATATDIALIANGTLVAHATPEALLLQVEGKVWEWVVSSADLNAIRQRYQISSTNRRSDGVHVRVLGDEPPHGAQPVTPNLEDAYLFCLSRHRERSCRMSRSRVLFHMVRADFLERVRRYSFLLTLGFSVYLGYAMYSGQINMQLGSYRGVANSAWLGSVVGLIGSVFLSLIGFYVVKNTIQRDRETRVGRILAATPMSRSFYTLSKALSNLAVLSAMAMILSAAAVVIQLTHKGAGTHNLFDLLSPILIFSLWRHEHNRRACRSLRDNSGPARRSRKYRLFFPLVLSCST